MIPAVPDSPVLTRTTTRRVRISPAMVGRFAALTGDRSSLHVDDTFARRSAYREPIAHGMLPVALLATLPSLRIEGLQASLVALTGRFAAPVFRGDTLTLVGEPARAAGEDCAEFDYRIERKEAVVTSGTVTVRYAPAEPAGPGAPEPGSASLLIEPVELRNLRFEDIQTGDEDCLHFAVTAEAVAVFRSLLRMANESESADLAAASSGGLHEPNLLAALLYSTSIGVSLPGASATFLEFANRFDGVVEIDRPYRLTGRIIHRSGATRILKKELLVTPASGDGILARGKASTLVARPSSRMPSMEELTSMGTDFGLRGKVVLITGASRGIGETTAKLFALHGAKLVVNYHRGAEDARRIVEEIAAGGGEAVAIAADVSRPEEVSTLVAQAREHYGAIDVLVNNAARDYRPVPFLRLSWDDIQRDIDVIVKGAFLCCQQVIPIMLERHGGRIINISTIATDTPPPDQTKYVVAKSALVGLTRSLSIEFAARNIQVNLVVPSFVETDFVAHVPDGFRRKIERDIPMQRAASPVDVARAAIFLASDYSSFTTGQKVMVTGGGPPYL